MQVHFPHITSLHACPYILSTQDWDNLRTEQTDALDKILNELGSQRVPPDFHQTSTASSIFGSQDSEDEQQNDKQSNGLSTLSRSPSDTIQVPRPKPQADLKNWKTLRDFVDDQAIEDIFECMEEEHTIVEVSKLLCVYQLGHD